MSYSVIPPLSGLQHPKILSIVAPRLACSPLQDQSLCQSVANQHASPHLQELVLREVSSGSLVKLMGAKLNVGEGMCTA